MAFVAWQDQMSVKVEKIDLQHKRLIHMINELHQSIIEGQGKDVSKKLLRELIHYSGNHFLLEEQLFVACGYELEEEHKQAHELFISRVYDCEKRFFELDEDNSIELLSFLSSWFVSHFMIDDQKYVECLQRSGLK